MLKSKTVSQYPVTGSTDSTGFLIHLCTLHNYVHAEAYLEPIPASTMESFCENRC